jgi:hypothetical protein
VFHILVDSPVRKAVEVEADQAAEEALGVEEAVLEQGVVVEQVAVVGHHMNHNLPLVDILELDRRKTINFLYITIINTVISLATDKHSQVRYGEHCRLQG